MGGVVHPSVLTYSARPSSGIVSVLSSVVTMTIVGRLHMSLSSLSPLVQSFPRASRISPLRQSERGMASRVHCCQPLSSVQFSHSGMSDSLQRVREAVDCSTPGLSITNAGSLLKLMFIESVMPSNHLILCLPFSIHLQTFPASGSFQMSQFFVSGGQSIRVSASASVLPMNIPDFLPGELVGSPCSPRDSQESSPTHPKYYRTSPEVFILH